MDQLLLRKSLLSHLQKKGKRLCRLLQNGLPDLSLITPEISVPLLSLKLRHKRDLHPVFSRLRMGGIRKVDPQSPVLARSRRKPAVRTGLQKIREKSRLRTQIIFIRPLKAGKSGRHKLHLPDPGLHRKSRHPALKPRQSRISPARPAVIHQLDRRRFPLQDAQPVLRLPRLRPSVRKYLFQTSRNKKLQISFSPVHFPVSFCQ